jgi:hypothetical protein
MRTRESMRMGEVGREKESEVGWIGLARFVCMHTCRHGESEGYIEWEGGREIQRASSLLRQTTPLPLQMQASAAADALPAQRISRYSLPAVDSFGQLRVILQLVHALYCQPIIKIHQSHLFSAPNCQQMVVPMITADSLRWP